MLIKVVGNFDKSTKSPEPYLGFRGIFLQLYDFLFLILHCVDVPLPNASLMDNSFVQFIVHALCFLKELATDG
jgi:hypothetical protein